jgi:hypothetical protein
MPIEVELVGGKKTWRFERGTVTIGRDPASGIELPAAMFPGVSREHAVLQLDGASLRVQDRQSGNGTFLNGVRITVADLNSGDVLRLGPEGPELLICVPGVQAATVLGAPAVTLPSAHRAAATVAAPAAPATIASSPLGAATVAAPAAYAPASSISGMAGTIAVPEAAPRARQTDRARPAKRDDRHDGIDPAPPAAAPPVSSEQFASLERSLGALRRTTVGLLLLVVVLLIFAFYQSSQISANRDALARMHTEARGAVGAVLPELDQRLQSFNARIDAVDGKIQAAEDHFVVRLNQDLPTLLDRYISQKMSLIGFRK